MSKRDGKGTVTVGEARKSGMLVSKRDGINVDAVAFPSDVFVGLDTEGFDSNLLVRGNLTVQGSSTGTGTTFQVSGQDDVGGNNVTLTAGTGMTITTSDDTITFASSGGGGGSSLDGIDDQSSSNENQITITDTSVVINEDSDDIDFRVESNDKTSVLLVDGFKNQVLILADGTNAANSYKDNVSATGRNLPLDIGLYVSGAIDGKGQTSGDASRGTSVFAGDVVVSGSLFTLANPAAIYAETSGHLASSPGGNPTSRFHLEWNDGGLTTNNIEDVRNPNYWKYFPLGGEIVSVFANGNSVTNFDSSNPFTGQMTVRLSTFTNALVADSHPHTAGVIGTMTASPTALSPTEDGGTTFKHRALFDFTGASVTGTFVIPPGQLAAISFQGVGGGNSFAHLHVHVVYKRNLK